MLKIQETFLSWLKQRLPLEKTSGHLKKKVSNWHVLFFSVFLILPSVFSKDSDADCEGLDADKLTLHSSGFAGSHGGCLPHQSAHHDDDGPNAFFFPTGSTVLHPTGEMQTFKN